jgi:hypothetical protein
MDHLRDENEGQRVIMERCPIYILQRPQPRVLQAEMALGYNLLINRNHDEGHQPHIALENDSPLCCRNTRGEICTKRSEQNVM